MKKSEYEEIKFEVIYFEDRDVIVTSTPDQDDDDGEITP